MPLETAVAMSQGQIGYWLTQAINNAFLKSGKNKKVATIVSQVVVDKNDSAFKDPTKPIGQFYSEKEAKTLAKKNGWTVKEDAGRGWRRVVASPKPIDIVEKKSIQELVEDGVIVIATGGGGIPVTRTKVLKRLKGIDAVIDKDYASSKLAVDINADMFLILTTLDNAKINFKKENEESLYNVKRSEMEKYNAEGHFLSGSMKPKVEACINYLKEIKDGTAIITSIENAVNAVKGISGTIIKN